VKILQKVLGGLLFFTHTVHNVNNVNNRHRFYYALFPEYSFDRADEMDIHLSPQTEVDISRSLESIAAEGVQQTAAASSDESEANENEEPSESPSNEVSDDRKR